MASNENLPGTEEENTTHNEDKNQSNKTNTYLAEMLELGDRNTLEAVFLMFKMLRRDKKDIKIH